jgi:hypothetical protein
MLMKIDGLNFVQKYAQERSKISDKLKAKGTLTQKSSPIKEESSDENI